MEVANRKRCNGRMVAVIVAVFLILFWMHHEVSTLTPIDTSRKFMKDKILSSSNAITTSMKRTVPNSFPVQNTPRNGTIVVYLSGEMGNHLLILAKSFTVKLMANEKYGISAELVLRHQQHPKWVNGRNSIQGCFPKLRYYNFSAANTDVFDKLLLEQDRALRENSARLKIVGDQDSADTVDDALLYWKSMLESHVDNVMPAPFLTVAKWCPLEMIDRYLDQLERFFEFDKVACCKTLPDPDESVFHLRNFLVELPKKGKIKGFEELSPNKTAFELFGHLNRGDKVAITTRFGGKDVEPYVSALQGRGLQVRVIEGQTGTQDFCFLMSAQKELVGSFMSTFVTWAAYLGDMKRANLYRVMSPNTRTDLWMPFNWTHRRLKDRVFTFAYNSEEQDELEANEQQ